MMYVPEIITIIYDIKSRVTIYYKTDILVRFASPW